jgi:Holliday junction resolvasome RuvABC endonuclease subunit
MIAETGYVWGIDVAISKLAVGFADLEVPSIDLTTVHTSTNLKDGARLAWLKERYCEHFLVLGLRYPPYVIWVEEPIGRFPKPQLLYVAGIAQAVLYEMFGCPVWAIPTSKWKQESVGKGNANKEAVMKWVEAQQGSLPASQDEADAYAISYAGRRLVMAERWTA